MLPWLVACASVAAAQATDEPLAIRDVRFTVDAALAPETLATRLEDHRQHGRPTIDALCACLLDVRRIAEVGYGLQATGRNVPGGRCRRRTD